MTETATTAAATSSEPTKIPFQLHNALKGNLFSTCLVRMKMEPKLLDLLTKNPSSPEFFTPTSSSSSSSENEEKSSCYTSEEFEHLGYFGPLNDGSHMNKEHIYYEGYFHSKPSSPSHAGNLPVESMNPRRGYQMSKPAAPLEFRAFLSAFRKINSSWLKPLISDLKISNLTPESVFSDCAAQSHHGSSVEIHKNRLGGWHIDAPNSILHLAVSLHGKRKLHFQHWKEKKEEEEEDEKEEAIGGLKSRKKEVKTEEVYGEVDNQRGDVYLTSPSSFLHGVSYTECSFFDRILAVQCRTLVGSTRELRGEAERHEAEKKKKDDDDNDDDDNSSSSSAPFCWDDKAAIVGATLMRENVRLPTFAEVEEEMKIMKIQENEMQSSVGKESAC